MTLQNKLESFGLTNIGLGRSNNEDAFSILPHHHFFTLADGMGGHRAGEVAADEAVFFLTSSVEEFFLANDKRFTAKELSHYLKKTILHANKWIYHLGSKNKKFEGMGTTLCSLLFYEDFLVYAHVGDSRIYRFRKGKLIQLTEDHSLTGENSSNVLTRAVGTSPEVTPDVQSEEYQMGDFYLLCSDGLSNIVPSAKIQEIIQTKLSVKEIVQSLIDEALTLGGHDNITAVGIRVPK